MYSIEEIKNNYARFSDFDIERIAKNESKGLRKEVLGILKEEIFKRNLDKNLISWVETETNAYEGLERESLINKIQNLKCPKCSKNKKLYGFEINRIVSVIFLAHISRKERVLCKSCGAKEKLIAIIVTLFAGWWSRSGILLTPWTIIKDSANFMFQEKISRRILNRLVDENNGHFRRKGTTEKNLNSLIKKRNQKDIPEDQGYDFI